MAILDRIGTILRANLNDLLSRAEDPEKILNQTILDMREAQYQARMETAEAIAEGRKLERDVNEQREHAQSWLQKAESALDSEREDLAREALKRKRSAEDLADALGEQLEAHQTMIERLKTQLKALEAKIDEAERKRRALLARQKTTEASRSVNAAMGAANAEKAFEAFSRMERKIEHAEDKLAAEESLSSDLGEFDPFAELEDEGVEEDLAALKAKRNPASSAE